MVIPAIAFSLSALSGLRTPARISTLSVYFAARAVRVAVPMFPVAPMTNTTGFDMLYVM